MTRSEAAQYLAEVLAEFGDAMDADRPDIGDDPSGVANGLVRAIEWLDVDIYNAAVGGA